MATRTGASGRFGPLFALLVIAGMSVAMFGVARQVVADQEGRLLRERTGEVQAQLGTSTKEIASSLQVLGALGSLPDAHASRLFALSAAPFIEGDTVGVGVAVKRRGGYGVVAAYGEGPRVGAQLTGDLAALVGRAGAARALVSARLTEQDVHVVLAQPAAGSRSTVAYQMTRIRPGVPLPRTTQSPFRDLRIALYASPTVDPTQLVLSTETRVPLEGRVERVPFPVGTDQWLLAVGARAPLVGSFARAAPWVLLAAGLLTAVSTAAAMLAVTRRRAYAEQLVARRTHELDEARAFLERLAAAAPVVVRRLTLPQAHVTYVSPNIQRIFGVSAERARQVPFGEVVHAEDRGAFEAAYRQVAEDIASTARVEYRSLLGAEPRWVLGKFVAERNSAGDIVAMISYALDIEDRKEAERLQRDAQQTADSANQAKSEFLSRMSHELRTPLNAVLGFAQLLELDLPTNQQDGVRQILRAGRHLLDLINEVLDISRIEAGQLSLSPEPVRVSDLLAETSELMQPIAAARTVELRTAVVECDCHIHGDRQRTKQVLLNLLSNAVKYNRPRGSVEIVCTRPAADTVAIEVRDTGIGVAPEHLSRLFIPFERLGAEQSDIEGTGVGLALSQRLAQAMDGRIDVRSEVGVGSTFTLVMPAAAPPTLPTPAGPSLIRQRAPKPRTARTVLSIEDNLANSQLLDRIIARRPAWRVLHAGSGQLGLDLAAAQPVDLILLDLHLPDMHGVEVLQRLKAFPATVAIPVAILSADATPGQIERLRDLGAVTYLTKPIDVTAALQLLDDMGLRTE